ncbi:hypothetical protein HK405_013899 [Cladochytrium tenue]|nr:hypothetical protein HK405_013899 [Cladochytrium tenue]
MAGKHNIPTEILCEVMKAYADVGDGDFAAWPKRICRIEATLSLFRLRLVCRRWRDAIQSDRVARYVFGACLPVTDLVPGDMPYAWCRLFDGSLVGIPVDPWEYFDEDPNNSYYEDALAVLWRKPLYRQPPVCHWRCGRVTAATSSSDDDGGSSEVRTGDDHHEGECAPPGG